MGGSFSLSCEFGGCTQVSTAPKIRRRAERVLPRRRANWLMIHFQRHEEQAVQMQSDAPILVSFFTVQIRVSLTFRQEALAVATLNMYSEYILMVELPTEGVTCDPDKVLGSFPAPADLPGAA
jgi:hypothetical protein